jgi:hypothetical protein
MLVDLTDFEASLLLLLLHDNEVVLNPQLEEPAFNLRQKIKQARGDFNGQPPQDSTQ